MDQEKKIILMKIIIDDKLTNQFYKIKWTFCDNFKIQKIFVLIT